LKQINEKLINFNVYLDGSEYLGVADAQLPSIEYLTETVKGAGIAGEIESPTIGSVGSMTVSLNWRTVDPSAIRLAAPKAHTLDLRGAIQVSKPGSGTIDSVGIKATVKAIPKKMDTGKLEPGATMDTANEFECPYYKLVVDGKTMIEIDKYNNIFVIDGVDYLAKVRSQLGQ